MGCCCQADKFIEPTVCDATMSWLCCFFSVMRTDGGENEGPSWQAEPVGMLEMRKPPYVSRLGISYTSSLTDKEPCVGRFPSRSNATFDLISLITFGEGKNYVNTCRQSTALSIIHMCLHMCNSMNELMKKSKFYCCVMYTTTLPPHGITRHHTFLHSR